MARVIKTQYEFEGRFYEKYIVVEGEDVPPWGDDQQFSVIAKKHRRVDGHERVSGTAQYTHDIDLPGLLHGKILRCPHPHARIKRIATQKAEQLAGVSAVLTHLNTPPISWHAGQTRLFDPVLRYAGEEVACVIAANEAVCGDALALIEVEYQPLPFVIDPIEAMQPGAPAVQPGGNLLAGEPEVYQRGDLERGFSAADAVVQGEFQTPAALHNSLETHGSVAMWQGGALTLWDSTQHIHGVRDQVAQALGLKQNQVRVNKIVAVHDSGRVINPMTAHSQLIGGIIQGLRFALTEQRRLDPAIGLVLNADLEQYKIPTAADIQTAAAWLRQPGTAAIAGGTDLITELKKGIRTPQKLVNLKTIPQTRHIDFEAGNLKIGALATITQLEASADIAARLPALRQAAAAIGSPQLRNAATVGGNLCQRVRCWYYRQPQLQCWLKGGRTCYARTGLNRLHAVFGQSPCVAVNPSDLAPALMALDASVTIAAPEARRTIPLESLYRLPDAGHRAQTVLVPGEIAVEISIPAKPAGSRALYLKLMDRAAWSFALVSVAVALELNGDRVEQAKIVLGGVAGIPWRAEAAEKLLPGRRIDDALARAVSEACLSEAKPLKDNAYKIPMAQNLIKRALLTR
jgi:xanthine dehydrogenase YagS FAD-binding subunit